jgi:cytochrome P450
MEDRDMDKASTLPSAGTPAARRIAPGPRGNLVMGNLDAFKRGPVQMILDLHRQYGDVVRNRLGPYLTHALIHPDQIEYVLKDNAGNYIRGQFYDRFKLFFGEGLLTTDGDHWLRHRRIAQPLFHRRRIDAMATAMADCADEMLRRWDARPDDGQPFDILPEMMRVSIAVLSRVMFNVDLGDSAGKIAGPVELAIRAMMPQTEPGKMLPLWVPTGFNRKIAKARRTLDQVVRNVIEERRAKNLEQDDLITMFLGARDEQTGEGLPTKEIHDEVMTILLAGHETTGTGLAWSLYSLSRHPAVRRRLKAELDAVLGDRPPTLADLPNLPYLKQVVEEVLRMYPPIWGYTRDAVGDDEVGGYHIPAGSTVFLSPYATHRHRAFWDNPEAFDPDRFAPEQAAKRPRFAYFPFGGGQRQCIGINMAILQTQIIVAMVTQRYELEAIPGHPVEYGRVVSLRPIRGILMARRACAKRPAA